MIKNILIDVDNTLLDFDESAKQSVKLGFAEFGIPYSDWTFERFRKINLDMWMAMERGEITKEELMRTRWQNVFKHLDIDADGIKFEHRFRELLNECAIQIDGAMDALEYLASKYPVSVASNAPYNQQLHRLSSANMLQYIDNVFVSEKIGFAKPNKEFFDACFANSPFTPDETVMIGDSLTADINGAIAYGIHTCWFNHYGEDASNVKCDWVVHSMAELKDIF